MARFHSGATGEQRIGILKSSKLEVQLLPAQQEVMEANAKIYGLYGGLKYGKSLFLAYFTWAMCQKNPDGTAKIVWMGANTFQLCKYMFDPMLDLFYKAYGDSWRQFAQKAPSKPQRDKWILELSNGITIKTVSFSNPDSLHQDLVWGFVGDEFGLCPAYVWDERIWPRVNACPGSWVLLGGTFEETGIVQKRLLEESKVDDSIKIVTAATWENTFLYPGGREDPAIVYFEQRTPPDIFDERYGARPKRPALLVYKEFGMEHHVGDYPYAPDEPVELWVDPGITVYCVLVVQKRGNGEFWIIDEIYVEGYATEGVKEIASNRPWFEDMAGGAIDISAGEAKKVWASESGGGGFALHLRFKKVPILAGIERVKTYLHSQIFSAEDSNIFEFQGKKGIPKLFFNKRTCPNAIKEFSKYRWPKSAPRRGEPRKPVDRADHAMNALAYGLVDAVGFVPRMRREPTRRPDKFKHI